MKWICIIIPIIFHSIICNTLKPSIIYVQDPECYTSDSVLNITITNTSSTDVVGCPGGEKCEFNQVNCPHLSFFPIYVSSIFNGPFQFLSKFHAVQQILILQDLKNLPNRSISIAYYMFDSQCTLTGTIDILGQALSQFPRNFFKLVIGPTCFRHSGEMTIISHSYNLFRLDTHSHDPSLSDRSLYPYLCRVTPSSDLLSKVVLNIFYYFNWYTFDILRGSEFLSVSVQLSDLITTSDEKFYKKFKIRNFIQTVDSALIRNYTLEQGLSLIETIYSREMRVILYEAEYTLIYNLFCSFTFSSHYNYVDNIFVVSLAKLTRTILFEPDQLRDIRISECGILNSQVLSLMRFSMTILPIFVHTNSSTIHSITKRSIGDINIDVNRKCLNSCNYNYNTFYDGVGAYIYLLENLFLSGRLSLDDINYDNSTTRSLLYNEYFKLEFEGLTGTVKWFQDGSCERHPYFVVKQVRNDLYVEDVAVFDFTNIVLNNNTILSPRIIRPFQWGLLTMTSKYIESFVNTTNYDNESLKFPIANVDCPHGTFFNRSSGSIYNSNCLHCPPGTEPGSDEDCALCDIGKYSLNGTQCLTCDIGYYQTRIGQSSCDPCPLGTLWQSSTECVKCRPGSFGDHIGFIGESCKICPDGSYQNLIGQSFCHHCNHLSNHQEYVRTVKLGSSSQMDCACQSGYYLDCLSQSDESLPIIQESHLMAKCSVNSTDSTRKCQPCPTGFSCSGGHSIINNGLYHTQPILLTDYMSTTRNPYTAYICLTDGVCVGGPIGHGSCNDLREGIACGDCPNGYYTYHDKCRECSWISYSSFFIFIFLIPFVVFIVYAYCNGEYASGLSYGILTAISLGMILTLIQTLTVLGNIPIDYPGSVRDFFSFFGAIAFDLDVFSLSCLFHNKVWIFLVQCLLPLCIPICILTFFFITNRYLDFTSELIGRTENSRLIFGLQPWLKTCCINTFGHIFQAFYIAIIAIVSSPFACYSHTPEVDQKSILKSPTVICGSSEHVALLSIGVIFTLLYGIGFITWCIWGTIVCMKINPSMTKLKSFRFLFYRFKPSKYYWGIVILFRNFLISFTPLYSQDDANASFLILLTILIFFLFGQLKAWPWKTMYLNMVDLAVFTILLFVICISSVFNPEPEDDNIYIVFIFILLSVAVGVVLCLSIYGVVLMINPNFKFRPIQRTETNPIVHRQYVVSDEYNVDLSFKDMSNSSMRIAHVIGQDDDSISQ